MSKDRKSTNHNINSEQKHNTMKEMDNMKETETLKTRMNNLGCRVEMKESADGKEERRKKLTSYQKERFR